MLVLRTSNFQGTTIRPIVPRHKHSIVFIGSPLNFLSRASSKIILNYFQLFSDESREANVKVEKENKQKPS